MPKKQTPYKVTELDLDDPDFQRKNKEALKKGHVVSIPAKPNPVVKDDAANEKTPADEKKADKYVRLLKNISEYYKDEKQIISTRKGILSNKMKELNGECVLISLLLQEKMDRVTRLFLVKQNEDRKRKIEKYDSLRDALQSKKDNYEYEIQLAESYIGTIKTSNGKWLLSFEETIEDFLKQHRKAVADLYFGEEKDDVGEPDYPDNKGGER